MGATALSMTQAVVELTRLATGPSRRLLGLTGPPGAGKTTAAGTLVSALVDALGPGRAVVVGMDGFHLAQAELERLGRTDRKGAPDTFDAAGFVALLARLRSRQDPVVYAPLFRRELEEPIAGAQPVPRDVPLVVVEGNYLLLDGDDWGRVRPLLDACWYVDPDDDLRLERLIGRHVAHGRSPAAAREWVLRSDQANARLIEATRDRADRLLSWG
jgi:pantothenate kinase